MFAIHCAIEDVLKQENLQVQGFRMISPPLARISLIGESSMELLRSMMLRRFGKTPSCSNIEFFSKATASTQTLNNVWQHGKILSFPSNNENFVKNISASTNSNAALKWPVDGSQSTLWDINNLISSSQSGKSGDTIDSSARNNKSVWNLIQKQLQNSFSGEPIDLTTVNNQLSQSEGTADNQFFVILVRRRNARKVQSLHEKDFDGWSIILHSDHVKDVFVEFTAKGAIAIGVDEMEYLQMINGILSFPRDFLDSDHGSLYWTEKENELMELIRRRPKSKQQFSTFASISSLLADAREAGNELTVIRNYSYLSAFSLPTSSIALTKEVVTKMELLVSNIDGGEEMYLVNNNIEPLPKLPNLTFVHVRIRALGRGLPKVGGVIFATTHSDLLQFAKHHLSHKTRLHADMNGGRNKAFHENPCPKSWHGLKVIDVGEFSRDRLRLGVITSGYHDRCNRGKFEPIALCNVEKIHETARQNYELFGHPYSHKVVLFQNPGSQHLRPAFIEYL